MTEQEYFNNNQLSLDIWNKKYRVNNESFEEWLDRVSGGNTPIRQLIKEKKFIFGGRILAGRGITGSKKTLSNCYCVTPPEDNLESIFDTAKKLARTYSTGGGCGTDVSALRPSGAITHNAAKESTGPTSFMELYSFITGLISQQGRRGALMLTMNCSHPDIEGFINLKTKKGVCEKANISVKVSDDFMTAVLEDKEWVTEFTSLETGTITRTFRARDLLKLIAKRNWEWAEPGMLYWDRITKYNMLNNNPDFKLSSTNPCQPAEATLLTPYGLTTMGEIEEGDLIWSSEGWTKVIRKWSTGIKDVYKYRTSRGVFVGTENHRLVSRGQKVEARDCEAVDALTGVYKERDFIFHPQTVMDGLVLGDGYVHKASNNLILLCIGENDFDYFTSEIGKLINRRREGVGPHSYEINTDIKYWELPRKWEIAIPDRYMTADRMTVCSLLRGLYSANGSVVNASNGLSRITYKTTSPILRDQIQILLSSLGISSYYTTNKPSTIEFSNGIYTCKESYDVNITTDRCRFMNLIGFIQDYKIQKICNIETSGRGFTNPVIEKVYLGQEEVFDITVDNESHTYWTGGLNVSNCGELPLPAGGSCLLGSINLGEFVVHPFTPKAAIDYTSLIYTIERAVEALNEVLDEGADLHPLEEQRKSVRDWRQIGLGTFGMADMLIKLGIKYGSEGSIALLENLYWFIASAAVCKSNALAAETGAFPMCDNNLIAESSFIKALRFPPDVLDSIRKFGLRNGQLLTCAPTGSIATMLEASSGVEPHFALKYVRKTQSLDGKDTFYEVNAKIVDDYFTTVSANDIVNNAEENRELPSYFVESKDIDPIDRIKVQAALQKYIDNSISSTINLPETATIEDVYRIYIEAWKNGLKGCTVYRQGCLREGILTTKKPLEIPATSAPKRPVELPCDIHQVTVKGEQFIVCVGKYNNSPYEVFVFRMRNKVSLTSLTGIIRKHRKGVYSLTSSELSISNLLETDISLEEKAATLYSSMLLRHGISIKYIVKTAKKVNDNISSFSSAMCRVLAKYMPVEKGGTCPECGAELVHSGGCESCPSCGYSKCG